MVKCAVLGSLLIVVGCASPPPRVSPSRFAVSELGARYEVSPDVEYIAVGDWHGKLDLYLPEKRDARTPTLIWFHGGGWTRASKEEELLYTLPYLERGWSVVNVEYRLSGAAPAPAAVEDCRCAVGWLFREAGRLRIGTETVVVSGISAGGHLALMTAFMAGAPAACPSKVPVRIAAVVNWFGPSDLTHLEGEAASLADAWIGAAADHKTIALEMSPHTHVRAGLPPVITLHGTNDDLVPYQQSVALHRKLVDAGVKNRLVSLPGGHGYFSRVVWDDAWQELWRFVDAEQPRSSAPTP